MDGVSHLVDQREDIVQRAVKVQKHVGMHAVDADRVGAAPLALVLTDIDPAVPERLPHVRQILLPERRECLQGRLLRLLVGDGNRVALHHRHVDIVHVELLNPEKPLPQAHISVKAVHVMMHGADQPVADRGRDVVLVHRRLEIRPVLPRLRIECELLYLPVVERGERVPELKVAPVEFLKDLLPERAVPRHLERHEAPV